MVWLLLGRYGSRCGGDVVVEVEMSLVRLLPGRYGGYSCPGVGFLVVLLSMLLGELPLGEDVSRSSLLVLCAACLGGRS